ncbi:putative toxin-antitoxin system toxin component, PIN family [candidate division KSB1 bacterium]|nr:putative toxin-antitoxin system toxin component, PIN family [candidate division KSB1 bacterium]
MKVKPKAVIDTNIFLSGLLNEFGAPAKLIKHFQNDEFLLVLSENILQEYQEVILEFNNDVLINQADDLFLTILNRAIFINPSEKHDVCRDKDDNKFIDCAIAANAEYIVTKNIKHFPIKKYKGIKIVKIKDFLTVIEQNK